MESVMDLHQSRLIRFGLIMTLLTSGYSKDLPLYRPACSIAFIFVFFVESHTSFPASGLVSASVTYWSPKRCPPILQFP